MSPRRPRVTGVICLFFMAMFSGEGAKGSPLGQDSLQLHQPENVSVEAVMNVVSRRFLVFVFFDDVPDSLGTFIHQPDTVGWRVTTAQESLSVPSTSGFYKGDIDRTINFLAVQGGVVGQSDSVGIRYDIQEEEEWSNTVNIGLPYTPGDAIDFPFINAYTKETLDLGLQLSFSAGIVDQFGQFFVGCEDFEGFHIWRGIKPDGSDLVAIGELSKEEAAGGSLLPGGSIVDSVYYYDIIPRLRESGVYYFEQPVSCLGSKIRLPRGMRLGANQLAWFDCNVFNGFTYYYTVTTFDRGYNPGGGSQGLRKFDNCQPAEGEPYPCPDEIVPVSLNVIPQNDLRRIYAVPNPYRTGGSVFTTPNYHNFPDNMIRFVNVPSNCSLKIYTVSGDLVWEVENREGLGNIEWDARNQSGEDVASGVYVYKIEDLSGNRVYGRLIVIR